MAMRLREREEIQQDAQLAQSKDIICAKVIRPASLRSNPAWPLTTSPQNLLQILALRLANVRRSACTTQTTMSPNQPGSVPIVCIAMSAGGFQALQTIVKQLNPATGMAFVIVCHLTPTEPTCLPWLLSLWSPMPAALACSDEIPKPNHIYVIPPGQEVTLSGGLFRIRPRSKKGWSNVVTLFLNSLIEPEKTPCVAVILSGDDCDGTAAIRAFHDRGGITICQDLHTASHKDMPRSAIQTGSIDYILLPEAIADKLEAIAHNLPKVLPGLPKVVPCLPKVVKISQIASTSSGYSPGTTLPA
jgi:chemotaxis response regulator CheB